MGILTTLLRTVTWWNGQTLNTQLYTWRKGVKVGEDAQGNIFYHTRDGKRRWVIFNGESEATRVDPDWHGWLHHQTDVFPDVREGHYRQKWQKPHQDNQTGSAFAYLPKGHPSRHESRQKSTGDYEPWTPPK
jgi:NADH:ubiquinone oxidoreductase subunit